jgi:hypothetical protein
LRRFSRLAFFDGKTGDYRLIYRGIRDAYYCFDTHTKKRESLGINDANEAQRLVDARNEAVRHVGMNLQIAQVYLQHSDPALDMVEFFWLCRACGADPAKEAVALMRQLKAQ